MRKIITVTFIAIFFSHVCKAQFVNIPDDNFRNYLNNLYPGCFNETGQVDTTCSEIVHENSLIILGSVVNLDGLQYFKNLETLEINVGLGTGPSVIPAFVNSLKSIWLYNIACTSLPQLPPGLEKLSIDGCQSIQHLPTLPASLKVLSCYWSFNLQHLPVLPANLDSLNLSSCGQIRELPTLPNTLRVLIFPSTGITNVPALPASLKVLNCRENLLTSLPALPAQLEKMDCRSCPSLTALPALPATLTYLNCNADSLINLPALPAALRYLNCGANPLTSLPQLPGVLTELYCNNDYAGYSSISILPTLPDSLRKLSFGGHPITVMPTLPALLEHLDCNKNLLTTLPDLPAGLKFLSCSDNQITMLPEFSDSLYTIFCNGNLLTTLPALPGQLWRLDCSNNNLNSLPALPKALNLLNCVRNNIYCLPELPIPILQDVFFEAAIFFDGDKIKCIPNQSTYRLYPSEFILNAPVPPLCNPTNNINQCQAFPVMNGIVFYDNNSNGIKDAGEPVKSNVRINLSNNSYSFSNNNGQYEIGADSTGTYLLTAVAPRYFNYSPTSYNYNFNTYDTLVTNNFALQASIVIDELTIHITPINWAARPGFSFPYMISYENTGTTTLSPNIVFDYDQTKLNYNTSSITGVTDNTSTLSFNTGNLSPGQSGSCISYFTLRTTASLGDSLLAEARINANAFEAIERNAVVIRGAFDPNDKQATPQLSPLQVINGEYIDYTIRFQNTGTDTAFTVVISDTLSDDLQTNTLQMIAASHNCKTTVKDNIVFFEFLNILLSDSNVNEPKSHGFVSFKIKPQTTVAINTTIPNKAAIYFDYNAPVITNTAGTLIKEFTVVSLKLISFSAVPHNDNTTSLYWNTVNEINTRHFVIERSNDGTSFNSVTNVFAKGKANNNYNATVADATTGIIFYRLKMVDNDGSFTYSPIIKIDNRKNAAGLSILSNPVNNFIITSTTDRTLNNTQATIINMQGAVVRTFTVKEGSQTIEVNDLPAGVYYLRTLNGNSRFLKQ